MLTPRNFRQEEISKAYLSAIVFEVGYNLSDVRVDTYGVDGTIVDASRAGMDRVDFQLKAATAFEESEEAIAYDLRVEDYRRLIPESGVPRALILYLMPRDENEWVKHSEDELCLRRCAYWLSLSGKPKSANVSHQRVSVPKQNVLSLDGLRLMLDQLCE